MAAGTTAINHRQKPKVCFSFAAYSKTLISHLHHHSTIPIAAGLTETELTTIESTFSFTFPPDLRSILREGLPIGQGFPNWRSSSLQQLDILINLPILGLCKEIHRKKFWYRRWGLRPVDNDKAVELAKGYLKKIPVLVPVYRNCYVSCSPVLAGNPVFYVNGVDVKLCSYDVIGFFEKIENLSDTSELKDLIFSGNLKQENELFCFPVFEKNESSNNNGVVKKVKGTKLGDFLSSPVWAATEARKVEFWSDLMELRRVRWWCDGEIELGRCLEDVRLKLRNGGWDEDDVGEMMMEMDGGDQDMVMMTSFPDDGGFRWRVRELSMRLLSGGWSKVDVVELLGCLTEIEKVEDRTVEIENGGDWLFDFQHMSYSCVDDSQCDSASLRPVLEIHAIKNTSISIVV
uniref:uncharacterized protein LOC122606223 n=1 Tax=Erigeron canadensis TaxID=72917 RepID=UPI001CB8F84E|nr:uncharacterized protein LOC122606223 [Erigeron canadensis]